MKKKMGIILIFVAVMVIGGKLYFSGTFEKKDKKEDTTINYKNINSIKLYKRDLSTTTLGEYVEVELTSEQITKIKNSIASAEIKEVIKSSFYGKYKLVIDNNTYYFDDLNKNEVYHKELNMGLTFPVNSFDGIISKEETCSCCPKDVAGCKINLCTCE